MAISVTACVGCRKSNLFCISAPVGVGPDGCWMSVFTSLAKHQCQLKMRESICLNSKPFKTSEDASARFFDGKLFVAPLYSSILRGGAIEDCNGAWWVWFCLKLAGIRYASRELEPFSLQVEDRSRASVVWSELSSEAQRYSLNLIKRRFGLQGSGA